MGFACITSPSKVTRLGFSVLMRMGLLVSTWPPAGRAATASVAATSKAAPVPAHSILLECGDFEIASATGMRKRSKCVIERSEERRVGKECRSGESANGYQSKSVQRGADDAI